MIPRLKGAYFRIKGVGQALPHHHTSTPPHLATAPPTSTTNQPPNALRFFPMPRATCAGRTDTLLAAAITGFRVYAASFWIKGSGQALPHHTSQPSPHLHNACIQGASFWIKGDSISIGVITALNPYVNASTLDVLAESLEPAPPPPPPPPTPPPSPPSMPPLAPPSPSPPPPAPPSPPTPPITSSTTFECYGWWVHMGAAVGLMSRTWAG